MKDRFGDFLIDNGFIDQTHKKAIQSSQRTMSDLQLSQWIVKQGMIDEKNMCRCMAKFYGIPFVTLDEFSPDPQAVSLISENIAKKLNAVPVSYDGKVLQVASNVPLSLQIQQNLRQLTGKKIQHCLMCSDELANAIKILYQQPDKAISSDGDVSISETIQAGAFDAVKVVDQLLNKAVRMGASDIHIEPESDCLRVRFRIDGVLRTVEIFSSSVISPLTSRLKVMSGMNIAERRAPQDGGFRFETTDDGETRNLGARVSTIPCFYGEKVVLRMQSSEERLNNLDNLGFEHDQLEEIKRILSLPHGIFLTTGPSGSGKTTTLYAALNFLLSDELNIVTIEDPIERHVKGIVQTQIDQKYSFHAALKALLRQDPDVIMVGEIRDGETARLALQAALTGHMVLSTLHTNDATSAVARFIDMGCEPFLVNSTVHGVLAQRLVRRLCMHCRKEYKPDAEELKILGIHDDGREFTFYAAQGCPKCRGTGYRGRVPLYELLVVDSGFRKLVASKSDPEILREYAINKKMRTLREDGIIKICKGLTSTEEVLGATTEG